MQYWALIILQNKDYKGTKAAFARMKFIAKLLQGYSSPRFTKTLTSSLNGPAGGL